MFVPVDQRPRCLKISWALLLAPYRRIGKSKLVAIGLHGEADTSKKQYGDASWTFFFARGIKFYTSVAICIAHLS